MTSYMERYGYSPSSHRVEVQDGYGNLRNIQYVMHPTDLWFLLPGYHVWDGVAPNEILFVPEPEEEEESH